MSRSLKGMVALAICSALLSGVAPVANAQAGGAEALFKAKCAMCHGADAVGNTPMGKKFNIPDLRA